MSKRLCLVNPYGDLARAFEDAGWEVWTFNPPAGDVVHLPNALDKAGFAPDLLIQRENMVGPVLLAGLEELGCPRLFWAMDPHLNLFWHKHYAALFDLTLSTQAHLLDDFAKAGITAAWMPWFAPKRPWTPWKERPTPLGFAGRVTDDRLGRKLMVTRLQERFGLVHVQDLAPAQMFDFYDRTRLAPNESILAEINFRLFESAGCGCLCLTQDLPHQDELFEPGREMEPYADVLELEALATHYLKHPDKAEAIGRAAWKRAGRDHLAADRVRAILDLAANATRGASTGADAVLAWGLARFNLHLSGKKAFSSEALEQDLSRVLPHPEALAALITLHMLQRRVEKAAPLVAALLADPNSPKETAPLLAGSMAALKLGRLDWAWQLFFRCARAQGREPRPTPDRPALLRAWAEILTRQGIVLRSGFIFDPAFHLPATAMECLVSALEPHGRDLDAYRRIDAMLAKIPGMDHIRLGFLSHLSLHNQDDWRLALNLGLVNLRAYRADQGIEEIRLARDLAAKQGVEGRFNRALEARDRKGLAAKALPAEESDKPA